MLKCQNRIIHIKRKSMSPNRVITSPPTQVNHPITHHQPLLLHIYYFYKTFSRATGVYVVLLCRIWGWLGVWGWGFLSVLFDFQLQPPNLFAKKFLFVNQLAPFFIYSLYFIKLVINLNLFTYINKKKNYIQMLIGTIKLEIY